MQCCWVVGEDMELELEVPAAAIAKRRVWRGVALARPYVRKLQCVLRQICWALATEGDLPRGSMTHCSMEGEGAHTNPVSVQAVRRPTREH